MGICQASYINPHEMNMSMLNNFNRSNMLKNIQHKYPEENITFKNGNLNNNNQFSMNNNFGNFNNIGNMNYNFGNIKNNFAFDYNTNSNIENLKILIIKSKIPELLSAPTAKKIPINPGKIL